MNYVDIIIIGSGMSGLFYIIQKTHIKITLHKKIKSDLFIIYGKKNRIFAINGVSYFRLKKFFKEHNKLFPFGKEVNFNLEHHNKKERLSDTHIDVYTEWVRQNDFPNPEKN
jgi:hypothetical protein